MRIIINSRFKKYRLGILAILLVLSLGILSVSTIINIYLAKKTLTEKITTLSSLNINTNSSRLMLFTDQLFCLSMEIDSYPNIIYFLNSSEVDYYLEYLVLTKLREIVSIYPFVDSIQLYNQEAGRIIDTKNDCSYTESYSDQELVYILNGRLQRNMMFISRKGMDNSKLLTLIYYSGNLNDTVVQYAVIININEDVFYQFMNIDESIHSQHFLLDENKVVISHTDKSFIGEDFSDRDEIKTIFLENNEKGMKRISARSENRLLFYQRIPDLNWLFIYSTDMTQLFDEATRIQTKMLTISGILFFISVVFSVISSKILYKPINELVRKISPEEVSNKKLSDIEIISVSYDNIVKTKDSLLLQNQENFDILQKNLLRRIFLTGIEQHELEHELKRFKLDQVGNNRVILAALPPNLTTSDASKLFSEFTSCIIISLNKETLAVWVLQGEKEAVIREYLEAIMIECPGITFSLSDLVYDNLGIQEAYRQAEYYLNHKIILGYGRIIDSSMIKGLEEKTYQYPFQLEKEIIASMNAVQKEDFSIHLKQLFIFCRSISFNHIEKTIIKIGQSCLRELGRLYPSEDTGFHLTETWKQIGLLEDMEQWFLEIFDLYHTYYLEHKLLSSASNINKQKITKAIDYIQEHYMDINLSLTQLSDAAELSPNYFNSLFKQVTGITLPNYITQYRYDVAKQYLKETNDKISKVAKRTGFENINYFYYKFKKDMGMTPLEYRNLYKK